MRRYHRSDLPQIDDQYLPDLFAYLDNLNIGVTSGMVPIRACRVIQYVTESKDFTVDHPAADIPIILSQEYEIMDGNHRWETKRRQAYDHIGAHTIGRPTHLLLPILLAFPKAYRADTSNQKVA